MPKDSKPKRGRPVGSPNATYLDAVEIPAACPSCRSVELVAVKGAQPIFRDIAGKLSTGVEYGAVEWQRRQCKACGQHVTVRKFFPRK